MQPKVNPTRIITVKSVTDVVFDPSKLKIGNIGPLLTTCGGQLGAVLGTVKQQPIAATLALIPDMSGTVNPTSLPDTAVTFKPIDQAIKTKLASWNADTTVPTHTVAYTEFAGAIFLDDTYNAILCLTNNNTHRLFLNSTPGGHVWYGDLTIAYCKKGKLFLFNSIGYAMSLDFGI